jgi:uncharacterized protein YoxC
VIVNSLIFINTNSVHSTYFPQISYRPLLKVVYSRKPEQATFIQDIYAKFNRYIRERIKRFDGTYQDEIVLIRRARYDALNQIIKSNEELLLKIDNDVKIDEIEKTVHQLEDSHHRMEIRFKSDSEMKKDQLLLIRHSNFQLENKINLLFQDSNERRDQLNRIFSEIEKISSQIKDVREIIKISEHQKLYTK